MKLSEAIREGAKTGPQCFGDYETSYGACCAVGGVLRVVGLNCGELNAIFRLPFPIKDTITSCPACLTVEYADAIINQMVHLNDDHRWTREDIADWVETQEAL